MSTVLDELRKHVGEESQPIVYSIDAGAIKFFAESIMDPDPLYHDEEYARTTKHGGIVAPPTFCGGATSVRNMKSDNPRTTSAIALTVPAGWVGFNGGDDFELLEPVRPGDTLTSIEKVTDVYEKEGGSGPLLFIIKEKTFTNQHGQKALIRRTTSIMRQSGQPEGNQ